MSTAMLATPARQPFGAVSGARLRNLTSLKNKQNALPSKAPSSAVKRHAPVEFDDVDSENLDPLQFFSASNKKAKAFDFDPSKLSKAPMFALTSVSSPVKRADIPPVIGQKRKGDETYSTLPVKRQEPSSAPAPAGRSPKQKHKGILSRRRVSANPFTRVDPPSITQSGGLPFSIDAAIAGTVPSLKTKPKPTSKGWQFDIHEDTPDDEMTNLMEHSTCTLDISDEEGRRTPKEDRENKENIAPLDYHAAGNLPVSRRDMMSEEVRSPLGDLDEKAFYPDGCDAASVFVVPADEPLNENVKAPVVEESTPPLPLSSAEPAGEGWNTLLAEVKVKAGLDGLAGKDGETPDIQIWESESAKAEDDADGLGENKL